MMQEALYAFQKWNRI